MQEIKGYACGARAAQRTDSIEFASEGLRLKSEMQRAVDEERYGDAAKIRDLLKGLEVQVSEASAAAAQAGCTTAELRFELGQRVVHARKGYRGVVCG